MMAGGAWASSFVKQMGISTPQTAVRSTVVSLAPNTRDLPPALHSSNATATRRGDYGYGVAVSALARVDPTWQSLRYARHFIPMFARRWQVLSSGDLRALSYGHKAQRRWAMDRPTPMEACRMLDPTPADSVIRKALDHARALIPSLRRRRAGCRTRRQRIAGGPARRRDPQRRQCRSGALCRSDPGYPPASASAPVARLCLCACPGLRVMRTARMAFQISRT